jgi:hypothetical protein
MMSLSPEFAELHRKEETGIQMWSAMCKRYENRSNTIAVFHAAQRLEEELRQMMSNTNDDLEIRNKALELADYNHPVSFPTLMMYTLQSLPSQRSESAMIQTQHWRGNSPAKGQDELEEQIRVAYWRYKSRKPKNSAPKWRWRWQQGQEALQAGEGTRRSRGATSGDQDMPQLARRAI